MLEIPETKSKSSLWYRCRLCGKKFSPRQIEGSAAELVMSVADKDVSHVLALYVPALTLHVCEDDRFGLADLIGAENDNSRDTTPAA